MSPYCFLESGSVVVYIGMWHTTFWWHHSPCLKKKSHWWTLQSALLHVTGYASIWKVSPIDRGAPKLCFFAYKFQHHSCGRLNWGFIFNILVGLFAWCAVLRSGVFSPSLILAVCHSTDCESLIRRMLAVDPAKRFSVAQIKQHRWMQADPSAICHSPFPSSCLEPHLLQGTYNEAVLSIMQTVGIDRKRTVEVRSPEIKVCVGKRRRVSSS